MPDSRALDPALFRDSSLREKVIEHIFVGELLRVLWRRRLQAARR